MIDGNGNIKQIFYRGSIMTAIFLAASGVGYLFRYISFPDTNIVVVYLLAVLMTAWLTRSFIFGFIASLLATFSFNYFFAEPVFTFSVSDPNYIVTFFTMTVTALITSTLTSHAQRSAIEAKEKETEAKAIYTLTNHLTDAKEMHEIASITASTISDCFSCNAACLCFDEANMPENTFVQQMQGGELVRRRVSDIEEMKHRIESLRTGYDVSAEFTDWPIYGRETILGVVRIPNDGDQGMSEAKKRLLRSMIESTALAMDRFRSAEQRISSRDETKRERYRANLLRAISHDIRTPLSGMIGITEIIIGMTDIDDPRYELLRGMQKSTDWLNSLVENILNLTRLQDGNLPVNKQWEAVEEVIGGAVSHIAARAPEHEISVNVPDELLLVPMDAKLIEQVIINLLDNAVKHTAPKQDIDVEAEFCDNGEMVKFTIKDRGTGILEKDLPNIFMMFYTSYDKHPDAEKGMGLGLAICDTIIKAHGGSLEAHNRKDGAGAEFSFKLPMEVSVDKQAQ